MVVLESHHKGSHDLGPLEPAVDEHIVSARCSPAGLGTAALTGRFQPLTATFMLRCAKIASSVHFQDLPRLRRHNTASGGIVIVELFLLFVHVD